MNTLLSGFLSKLPCQPAQRTVFILGAVVPVLLATGVTAQALLLPFTDYDTWANWGLEGKAFYLDANMSRVLTMYNEGDLHHSDYPLPSPCSRHGAI